MNKRLKRFLGNVSPWYVIGTSAILVVLIVAVAFMNYDREQRHMGRMLKEKGATIITAIEAGTRTGIMGIVDGSNSLQPLLNEIALQPDILYISLVTPSGQTIAHSDKAQIGVNFISSDTMRDLKVSSTPQWRIAKYAGTPKVFEVYKEFQPSLTDHGHGGSGHQNMRSPKFASQLQAMLQEGPPIIFIGMGYDALNDAIREDMFLTISTSGILLLLGFGGMISLFWLQSSTRSKKQLQDTRALTSEVVANIPEGIVVCDLDDHISFANDMAIEVLGLSQIDSTTLTGLPAKQILPSQIRQLRSKLGNRQSVAEQEIQLSRKDGRYLPVTVATTHIISEDGTSVGHLFTIRDLTQEKQFQAALRKADRMAAIGHMAAGVAHEVRNPLSSIKGYATYFGALFPEGSENRNAAEIMTAEVDRLNRVISELLEVARPTDILVHDTDIPSLLESSLQLVKQEATNAGVSLSFEMDQAITSVPIDPDRIRQALINLYINAIQAMPEGGDLAVSAKLHGPQLHLRISDTGTGLTQETVPRIFDPYFTTKKTGTGLGLAIVSKIIEAHKGTIKVETSGPQGTTFLITIPTRGIK